MTAGAGPAAAASAAEAATGLAESGGGLWRSLLQEAAAARPARLPNGTVVFLGDPAAGKTRLVQRFCAVDAGYGASPEDEATEGDEEEAEARENHGRPLLSYSFFDAVDPGEEDDEGQQQGGDTSTGGAAAAKKRGPGGKKQQQQAADEDEDGGAARVSVWSLSDPAYQELLHVALSPPPTSSTTTSASSSSGDHQPREGEGNGQGRGKEEEDAWEALSRTVCLIGLDLSRPWTFERALQRWVAVLRAAVGHAAREAAAAEVRGAGGDARDEEEVEARAAAGLARLRARQAAYVAKCYQGGLGTGSGGKAEERGPADVFSVRTATPLKKKQQTAPLNDDASLLPEGVLKENLGVPLIVVGLKADLAQADSFEAEQRSQFAQRFLRRFCLRHGAALAFASGAADANRRRLQRYLLHRYPEAFPVDQKAHAHARREALFVPAGWDSAAVIATLVSPNAPWPADAPFGEVVAPPKAERGRWDPFPPSAGDDGGGDDGNHHGGGETDAEEGEEEQGNNGDDDLGAGVESDAAWLDGLARQLEQQLGAAAAGSGEDKAASSSSSSRRKDAGTSTSTTTATAAAAAAPARTTRSTTAASAGSAAAGSSGEGGAGVRSFFEGLLGGGGGGGGAPAPKK